MPLTREADHRHDRVTLALFGSRWEQLPGEFLGEVWVAALPWDVQRPVQRSASSSLTSQRRDDTELPHQVEQRRDAPVLQRP